MRTGERIFEKNADSVLDFSINWTNFLASGTISSSDWTVDSGLTVLSTAISGVYTTIWISGGIATSSYDGRNVITAGSLRDSVVFSVYVLK